MKQKIINRFWLALLPLALFSCKNDGTVLHKNITGNAGEVVVVISNENWEGKPGEVIRRNLAQEHLALPQDEPLFDLVHVPREGFKSIFKSTRNIIQTFISPNADTTGVVFKDDVWAYPQATVSIHAKNAEAFEEVFNENKNRIMSYFLSAERERLTMNYKKYFERGIYNVLNEDFDLTMKVAPGFRIAKQEKDLIWLRYETPDISQGIVLYTYPYVSQDAFNPENLTEVRDSVFKTYIPGPTPGSYMATETRVDQTYNVLTHNGHYATEMRGLWRLINDFMGGPFISLAVLDEEKQQIVVAYGYVYAPNKDKRNFLRQVEAMIYSLKMNPPQEDDPIAGNSEKKGAGKN